MLGEWEENVPLFVSCPACSIRNDVVISFPFSLKRSQHIYVTVFASGQLPIHVVDTPDAQDFYKAHLGSEMLGVPLGSAKRLASLPALEEKELRFTGEGWNYSCGDIVLSSVGKP